MVPVGLAAVAMTAVEVADDCHDDCGRAAPW